MRACPSLPQTGASISWESWVSEKKSEDTCHKERWTQGFSKAAKRSDGPLLLLSSLTQTFRAWQLVAGKHSFSYQRGASLTLCDSSHWGSEIRAGVRGLGKPDGDSLSPGRPVELSLQTSPAVEEGSKCLLETVGFWEIDLNVKRGEIIKAEVWIQLLLTVVLFQEHLCLPFYRDHVPFSEMILQEFWVSFSCGGLFRQECIWQYFKVLFSF